jgi:hypothetical protein
VEVTGLNLVLVKIVQKKSNDKRRIPTHLLAYLPTIIIKKLKINTEQGRVVTILTIIKHQLSYLVYLCYLDKKMILLIKRYSKA